MMQFDEHICSIGLVQPSTSQNCGAPPKMVRLFGLPLTENEWLEGPKIMGLEKKQLRLQIWHNMAMSRWVFFVSVAQCDAVEIVMHPATLKDDEPFGTIS